MEKGKEKGNEIFYLRRITLVLIIMVVSLSFTYAFLSTSVVGKKSNGIQVGNLSVLINENNTSGISLQKAMPLSDAEGMMLEPYSFSVVNNGTITSNYVVYLDDEPISDSSMRMADKYIKYALKKDSHQSSAVLLSSISSETGRVLDSGSLEPGQKRDYDLKVWIDFDADNSVMQKVFSGRIRVEAEQIKE